MAITYGNTVHHWCAGIEASVADKSGSADTKSVVTVKVYWHALAWRYQYYGNGYGVIGSHTNGTTKTVFNSNSGNASVNQLIQTYTYEYDKGTSEQKVACKAVCQLTGDGTGARNGTSTATVDVTIPAKTKYTVAYNANKPSAASGSVSGVPSSQTKWHGSDLTLSKNVPTLSSYGFKGWNTKADGKGTAYSQGATYKSNANLTLYAQWALSSSSTIPTTPTAAVTPEYIVLTGDSGTVAPSFMGRGSAHQVRWRRRDRNANTGVMGGWSTWSALGGDGRCEGWGEDPTKATPGISRVGYGNQFASTKVGVPVDLTGDVDRTEIEWNVRTIVESLPAAGGTYGFTTIVGQGLAITSVVCNKTYRGVHVVFETNHPESDIASASLVSMDGSFSKASSTGESQVYLENSKFTYLPDIGDQLDVSLSVRTTDGYSATWRGLADVTLGGFYGEGPTVTCTVTGTTAKVTAKPPSGMSITGAWLVLPRGHGDRYLELRGSSPWTVMPPLGVEWRVLVTTNAGNRWGFDATIRDPIVEWPPSYHITSQDGRHDLVVSLSKNSPGPSFAPTYTRSRTETETYNRERPVYGYSDVTKAQWTLTGDLLDGEGNRAADWLAHDSHVLFRSPHGFWAQCAVNSLRIDLSSPDSQEVQVTLSEEVW